MTEEQAADMATRLTIALIEQKMVPGLAQGIHGSNNAALPVVAVFQAIQQGLLNPLPKQN